MEPVRNVPAWVRRKPQQECGPPVHKDASHPHFISADAHLFFRRSCGPTARCTVRWVQ